jgi:glutathione S-transferase
MNQVIGLLDAYGYRPMVWDVFVQRVRVPQQGGTADEAEIARGLGDAARCLRALEDVVTLEPYLVGDMLSLADLHAYPVLRYLALAPEGHALLEAQHPRLWAWLEMMGHRASVLRTRGPYDSHEAVAG